MQEDPKLGFAENHTARFAFLRKQHLDKVRPARAKVIADFELLSHTHSSDRSPKIDLTGGVNTSTILQCQQCGNKFGFFEKKHVCLLCKRVVCVNDSRLQQLIPPSTQAVPICRKCHTFVKFHYHQKRVKAKIEDAQNNLSVVLYSTLIAIKNEIVHELPKFRGIVFSLSTMFGDSPATQDKIREGVDDGGPLTMPPSTLEELFDQGMSSQKRLKHVFDALEEQLKGIQAASNDTKTQQKMISLLKQALADFLTTNLPVYRFTSQRLAEIKDHPKTRRLLVVAKEMIKQEEIERKHREQEEADRKRYEAIMGPVGPAIPSHPTPSQSPTPHPDAPSSFKDKMLNKLTKKSNSSSGNSIFSSALNTLAGIKENLDSSHLIPEILGVIPAMCPTFGGVPLSIRGRNFHQNVRVFFGDKKLDEWQVLWKSSGELTIISPQVTEEGPTDLAVENPNQTQRGVLEGILFVTNEPAILETFFGPQTQTDLKSPSSPDPYQTVRPITPFSSSPATSSAPPPNPRDAFSSSSPSYSAFAVPTTSFGPSNSEQPPPYFASTTSAEDDAPPSYFSLQPQTRSSLGPNSATSTTSHYQLPPNYTAGPPAGTQSSAPSSGSDMKVSRTFGHR